jgi:hypothetical protein
MAENIEKLYKETNAMSDAKIVNMAVCEYQLIEVGRDGG